MNGGVYRPGEVVAMVPGLTRRKLLYWSDTGLLRPEDNPSGRHRKYHPFELRVLNLIMEMRRRGHSIQVIRDIVPRVRLALERAALATVDRPRHVVLVWAARAQRGPGRTTGKLEPSGKPAITLLTSWFSVDNRTRNVVTEVYGLGEA